MSGNHRKTLITGGAGFIGSHLVEEFVKLGDEVRVLDNFSTGRRRNLECLGKAPMAIGRDFTVIEGDVRDYDTVSRAMKGTDVVLHQAALGSVQRSVEDPLTTQRINADGTLNVFVGAREHGVARVVYASSSSVYGDSERLPKREGEEGFPLSPYALTKRINEEHGRLFLDLYGLETIGLRYFNVYGPRQDSESDYAAVIPRFAAAIISGKRPVVYGDGKQSRDFTYVKDVVKANILALGTPSEACGRAYNVGTGSRVNLLELLDILNEILGTTAKPHFDPPRTGDVPHSSADPGLAKKMLGFTAGYDLRQGLGESIRWYKETLEADSGSRQK